MHVCDFQKQFQPHLNHQNYFENRASNGKYHNFHVVAQHWILELVVRDPIQQPNQQQFMTPNLLNTASKSTIVNQWNFVSQSNMGNMFNLAAISVYQVILFVSIVHSQSKSKIIQNVILKKINHFLNITVIPTRGTSPVVPQNGTDKCHLKMPRKPHNSVDNPLSWRFSPASDQQDQNSNEPPPPYPIMTQTGVTNYSPSIPNRQSPTSTTDGKHEFRLKYTCVFV